MKKYQLLLILISAFCYSQDKQKFEDIITLNDSIKSNYVVMIYKSEGKTNYSSVFTLFQDSISKNWKVTLYEMYKGESNKVVKIEIDNSKDKDLLWSKILISNIQFIPEKMSAFEYKLEKKYIVKEGDDYQIHNIKTAILDGEYYEVRLKTNKINKKYIYFSPENYLKEFTNVDELEIFVNFIKIVEEFLGRKL
jgi:hypothetical protein